VVLARVDLVGRDVVRVVVDLGAAVDEVARGVAALDLPPSILDHVGGVDLVCLAGAFFAAEDWGMGDPIAYCLLRKAALVKCFRH